MPDNVNYLVNGITGQVPNPGADIRLLQDEVLSAGGDDEDQYVRMMRERLEVDVYKRQAQERSQNRLALLMETICATGIRVSEVRYITCLLYTSGREKSCTFL